MAPYSGVSWVASSEIRHTTRTAHTRPSMGLLAMVTSGTVLPSSVPIPRPRLIGREGEIAAARSFLLDKAVPLLTLTGPRGVGKTRLALTIAQDVAPHV